MSVLVLPSRYALITGDNVSASGDVAEALLEAQALLEEELGRELGSASRTERMYPDQYGRAYPRVTPITVAPPGLQIDGHILYSISPFRALPEFIFEGNWIDLTYTGGFVERSANLNAPNALPHHMERDLCWAAFRALRPAQFQAMATAPAGASQMVVGDARIMFGNRGAPGEVRVGSDSITDPVWSKATLRYRRRGGVRAGRV